VKRSWASAVGAGCISGDEEEEEVMADGSKDQKKENESQDGPESTMIVLWTTREFEMIDL
jgi:hypothetical protein